MAARHHHVPQLMFLTQTHHPSALLAYQMHNHHHVIPLPRSEAPAASLPITYFFLNQGKFPCSKQRANGTDQLFIYFLFNNERNRQHISLKFRLRSLLIQTRIKCMSDGAGFPQNHTRTQTVASSR